MAVMLLAAPSAAFLAPSGGTIGRTGFLAPAVHVHRPPVPALITRCARGPCRLRAQTGGPASADGGTQGVTVREASWASDSSSLSGIRRVVFVEEQNVPEEDEWESGEEQNWHWLAEADGRAVGTARMKPDGSIGRMAVLKGFRSRGIGAALLRQATDKAHSLGLDARLNAQTHAVGFYERYGFRVEGDQFEDAGIPHVRMTLRRVPAGGADRDGALDGKILAIAVPALGALAIDPLLGVVDTLYVGRIEDPAPLAALGVCSSVFNFAFFIFNFFATATTPLVSSAVPSQTHLSSHTDKCHTLRHTHTHKCHTHTHTHTNQPHHTHTHTECMGAIYA